MRRVSLLAVLAVGLSACATTGTLAPGQVFPVFFANASVVPDQSGMNVVDAAVAWAQKWPRETITVTGYADPRAREHIAAELATRRADEIAALLEQKGVSPDRIKRETGDEALIGISGLGNRRVDIAVRL